MRDALRRSEGYFWCSLQGRNKECRCCFSRFTADLLEIANSRRRKQMLFWGFATDLLEMVLFLMARWTIGPVED